ncbi:MAG: GNAT family N-acetyltransferase [Dehalococcoidales bacterium]|nr:MAG: GNAT family N-acetyltransferase [Dehalococcoidales bacterium]
MLRGEKVLLRPLKRSDITNFLKWFNDPEVTQYLSMYLPMTEMAEEKWIEDAASRIQAGTHVGLIFEAIEGDSSKTIGTIGLHGINPKDHGASFGIAIGEKDYWGNGYGTEATRLILDYGFQQLNLHRIASSTLAFNERSIKLHKKVGFREEGRQREAFFRNNHFHDLVMFSILRNEWRGH